MNHKLKLLSLSVCATMGTATMLSTPATSYAGIIPDGDYQIQIKVTPSTTGYRYLSYASTCMATPTAAYCTIDTVSDVGGAKAGWNSSFTFGNVPSNSASQAMTDNDVLVSTGLKGSGIAGDGRAGTIDITVSGDNITITPGAAIGFQVDTIFHTAGGNFAQHLDPTVTGHVLSDMSGTVDAFGNMTFTPTGRLGTMDGPNPDYIDYRWNVNDVADPTNNNWESFTTGTVTTVAGSITGNQVVNVGPTLNGDAFDDFQATLVLGSEVGRGWQAFAGVAYYETWSVDIVSVNVPPTPPDKDGDGLPDSVEDSNGNGVVDAGETDPLNPDTDGDGLFDGVEDSNGNGLVDSGEVDPLNPDSDSDGALDGQEDTNGNGVVDAGEADPLNPDTDSDGLTDGFEINVGGTDPSTSTMVITGPLGDMNGDGDVDVGDTLLLQRKVLSNN